MGIEIGILFVLGLNSLLDWRTQKIWLPSLWLSIPFFLICLSESGGQIALHIACGALTAGAFLLLGRWSNGQIGSGDGAVLGVVLLALGFRRGMAVLFVSLCYAFLAAVVLLCFFHKKKSYKMPFVPFLLAGYVTELLLLSR